MTSYAAILYFNHFILYIVVVNQRLENTQGGFHHGDTENAEKTRKKLCELGVSVVIY